MGLIRIVLIKKKPAAKSAAGFFIGTKQRLFLNMGFKEPQRFIETARGGRENIRTVIITGFSSIFNRLAHQIGDSAIMIDQRMEMVFDSVDIFRIRLEDGGFRASRRAISLRSAFTGSSFTSTRSAKW